MSPQRTVTIAQVLIKIIVMRDLRDRRSSTSYVDPAAPLKNNTTDTTS